jgi:hypothetical protein
LVALTAIFPSRPNTALIANLDFAHVRSVRIFLQKGELPNGPIEFTMRRLRTAD